MNRRRFLAASIPLPLASRYVPAAPPTKPILIDSHLHVFKHAQRLMSGTDWPVSLKNLTYAQAVALYRDHLDFLSPQDHTRSSTKQSRKSGPSASPNHVRCSSISFKAKKFHRAASFCTISLAQSPHQPFYMHSTKCKTAHQLHLSICITISGGGTGSFYL